MQRVTPAMMRDTPIRVSGPFIFSPRTAPAMAVTAKGGCIGDRNCQGDRAIPELDYKRN